jgi:DNA-binding NtrC family response regulator
LRNRPTGSGGDGEAVLAKICLIGLEQEAAGQICRALTVGRHQVEHQLKDVLLREPVLIPEILNADIVFAGGEPGSYLTLLKRVREARPALPFVVVTGIGELDEWLDALEAGATDYCSVPIEARQLHWLMEYTLPKHNGAHGGH